MAHVLACTESSLLAAEAGDDGENRKIEKSDCPFVSIRIDQNVNFLKHCHCSLIDLFFFFPYIGLLCSSSQSWRRLIGKRRPLSLQFFLPSAAEHRHRLTRTRNVFFFFPFLFFFLSTLVDFTQYKVVRDQTRRA